MARYRLITPHYLWSPGNEWERQEMNLTQSRRVRRVYPVPRYIDPEDPQDKNADGVVIVTTTPSAEHPRDIHVTGPTGRDGSLRDFIPTPDMEPLDDEARSAVARQRPHWDMAFIADGGAANYGDALITQFEKRMGEILDKRGGAVSATDPTVAELLKQVEALQAQVAEATALQGAPKPPFRR